MLGNIMFQYAVGRALAIRNRTTLRLDLTNYAFAHRAARLAGVGRLLGAFSLETEVSCRPVPATLMLKVARRLGLGPLSDPQVTYREKEAGTFDSSVLSLPDGARLIGYFQSERYFTDAASTIRSDFTFRTELPGAAASLAAEIASCSSVGVHVRRGDYLHSKGLSFIGAGYYTRSLRMMRERLRNPRFFVFSDDIAWCRENLLGTDFVFAERTSEDEDPLVDLRLMSLCSHNIIANSSFSWWGAWLNANAEKTVVAPNRWFTDPAWSARAIDALLPEGWIRVDTA
jgi:hypothetical protein